MPMNKQTGTYIDLKNCTIYVQDGYTMPGAVNLMAGYMPGATSIVIDGIVSMTVLAPGLQVTFAGDTNLYYIASTVETSGTTTTVVLDVPLVLAVTDNQVITFGPHSLQFKVGDGTLTYSESVNREYKLDRGLLDEVRNGDQAPMDLSTTFAWTHITSHSSETIPSIEDVLKNIGLASTWVSTGKGCEPFSVDLLIQNSPKACVGEVHPIEIIRFPQFRYEKLDHDAKAGTIACSGKCNALTPTVTRV